MEVPVRIPAAPVAISTAVSRAMKANRAKGTKPEAKLLRMLWAAGARGYRKHDARLPGKPDVAYNKAKVAVFFHGCFWHLCPLCSTKRDLIPSLNRSYWEPKLRRNVERFHRDRRALVALGYHVVVIWGCQFEKAPGRQVERVLAALRRNSVNHTPRR
ncbi:MAG: very short patch repair endonuclease [Armatimonadota bacterium]